MPAFSPPLIVILPFPCIRGDGDTNAAYPSEARHPPSGGPFPASVISAFSASACLRLIGKVRGEMSVIACLQLRPLPIFAGKSAAAIGRAAFAFHFVAVVIRHTPVMGQFFLGANIANTDEDNVTAQAEVGVAGMITVEHGTFPFLLCNR